MRQAEMTPGEWRAHITPSGLVEIRSELDGRPVVIARVSTRNRHAETIDKPTRDEMADALAMAAAPDLLEIVRITIGNVRSLGPAGALGKVYKPYEIWLRELESAYEKATGELP